MVHIAADLPQFLQRRELAAFEQRLARKGYAYGVDLRRAAWIASSMLGDPLMRSVDRRWSELVHGLDTECLKPPRVAPPTPLLEELADLVQLLRAPLPNVRLLRPEVASAWPAVTPLSTTKGGIHWLVLDLDRVQTMDAPQRTFVLASALAHLQCDHGVIFSAYLMRHRGTPLRMVEGMMKPWSKIAMFSADRAGLVATQSLEVATAAIQEDEPASWMPSRPAARDRIAALEDFNRSQLMVRRRVLSDPDGGGWTMASPGPDEEGNSLSRRLQGWLLRGPRLRAKPAEEPAPEQEPTAPDKDTPSTDAKAEGEASETKAPPPPPSPPPLDPELAAALQRELASAWSLARCDARLTRRLKLL
ncbi:MAG: hypothetical protein AAF799_48560 [Myxococcota bacterium]